MPNGKTTVDATIKTKDKKAKDDGLAVIVPYLDALLPVYAQTTPARRAELRLHNPTLDAILSALERAGLVV